MKFYHGTDIKTAKIIVSTGILKGDYPLFGVGICTSPQRALNFANIRCTGLFIKKGLSQVRRSICLIEFDASTDILIGATSENCKDAFTLNNGNSPVKELRGKYRLLRRKEIDKIMVIQRKVR